MVVEGVMTEVVIRVVCVVEVVVEVVVDLAEVAEPHAERDTVATRMTTMP